jgi:pyruvate kinase
VTKTPGGSIRDRRRKLAAKAQKPKEPKRKVIVCRMEIDGEIQQEKALYFPEMNPKKDFDMPIVDASDLLAIKDIIKCGADFVAVPLVESKEDIEEVRDLLSVRGRHMKLLAKI